jgi:putative oxidoreductase
MSQANQRLLIPGFAPLYEVLDPLSWVVVRLAAGGILAWIGWGKVSSGVAAYVPAFAELGFHDVLWLIWAALIIEFVGGLCICFGLFTRFWAVAAGIEMLYITYIYIPNGFSWLHRGYQFSLMWGLILAAIAMRGGGPMSLDRKIGREL